MTDLLADYRWLERSPLDDIYCVSFIRNRTPAEALLRFGADADTIQEVTFDELYERVLENLDDSDDAEPKYPGAVQVGDWTVLIEIWGWQGSLPEMLSEVSPGTEVVSVCRHDYAHDGFGYAVNGEVITRFEPKLPQIRWGVDPDHLTGLMHQVGLNPDHILQDEPIENSIMRAFALASGVTGTTLSRDVLDMRLLAGQTKQ